jgi:hypothetical protein
MLSVIMLNVVMLNATNNPFMLSVIMLNVVMLNATNNPFMLNVVMPNVAAPSKTCFSTSEPRRLLLPHRPGTCVNRKKPVPLRIHRRRSGQVVPGIEPASVSRLHRRLPLVDDRHADVAHPPVLGSLRFARINFFLTKTFSFYKIFNCFISFITKISCFARILQMPTQ